MNQERKMHKALQDTLRANGLENEYWEHEGGGEHYSAEGADGTVYAELIQHSYNDNGYRVQFSHHYGHQGEYDWENVSVDYGEVSEEVQEWF